MRKYRNAQMAELAAELTAGLARLKRGYLDAAEAMLRIIEPDREYPYEFVVYRLTGYRPRPHGPGEPMSAEDLRADLLNLMLDVCDSAELRPGDFAEPVYDTKALSRRFRVSSKTIQRWRRRGLAARRLIFPNGKRRVAFLESSVRWFVQRRPRQVARSMQFKQMTDAERGEILRRARRMARAAHCSLSEVARRLADRTGRAVETIRYTIRNHDAQHPDRAVFPDLTGPLADEERGKIYQAFLHGASVPMLARRYRRTRSSIYRIINEMRARQLLERPIDYMYNPEFDLPDADDTILGGTDSPLENPPGRGLPKAPASLPPYLRDLYEVPLLTAEQERGLFRRYNYLKHKADHLRRKINMNRVNSTLLKQIERLLLRANAVKNRIVRANLRLVVSIAKKHVGGPQTLFELVSDGNMSLMRAVEKFDYSRGNRFSTYASWAIIRNFARSVPREQHRMERFSTGHEEVLDIASALSTYDPNEVNIAELRESIDVVLTQLLPTERKVLIDHYGLDPDIPPRTFEQMGRYLGMSKERVRQIESRALKKLREILHPQQADLLA